MHRGKLKKPCGTPLTPAAARHTVARRPAILPTGNGRSNVSDPTGPGCEAGPAAPEHQHDECSDEREVDQRKRGMQHGLQWSE